MGQVLVEGHLQRVAAAVGLDGAPHVGLHEQTVFFEGHHRGKVSVFFGFLHAPQSVAAAIRA